MSHSTVLVVIPGAANPTEAEAMLEDLLEPFNENTEVEGYPEYQDQASVDRAVQFYRDHPEYCPGEDGGEGPAKPFDAFIDNWQEVHGESAGLEALHEWTRQAVGAYCRSSRDDGCWDEEKGQFFYLSTYNPKSRWDWWTLGGRWHGYFQIKTGVRIGGEPLPAYRLSPVGSDKGRKEGTLEVPTFDGTQDAVLGGSGVFGDPEEENFLGRADLARKGDIDFAAMRAQAGLQADLAFDKWEEATKDLNGEYGERWEDLLKRVLFDHDVDPDGRPEPNPGWDKEARDAYITACHEYYRAVVDVARREYHAQPYVVALQGAELKSWFGDDHADWCVGEEDQRSTFVQRAIDGAVSTFALLKDGEWYEKGQMGWFGMASGEKDQAQWNREFSAMLDALDDDVYLALVDVHI